MPPDNSCGNLSAAAVSPTTGLVEAASRYGYARLPGEIGLAITMSTLTTIVVFLPVSLVEGPGQFFLTRLAIPVCVSLAASLLVALYLVFFVALLALFGSLVRNVPATALLTVGAIIVLGIIGLLEPISDWLPSYLVGGFDVIIAGGEFVYWKAIVTTVAAIAASLWIAIVRLQNREI